MYYGFHHPTKKSPTDLHKKFLALESKPKKNGTEQQVVLRSKAVKESNA